MSAGKFHVFAWNFWHFQWQILEVQWYQIKMGNAGKCKPRESENLLADTTLSHMNIMGWKLQIYCLLFMPQESLYHNKL